MNKQEIWKKIPQHPAVEISTFGNVRYIENKKPIHIGISPKGYNVIYIDKKKYQLHRLILSVHSEILITKDQDVHHIDDNKTHNHIDNLQVIDHIEHAIISNKKRKLDLLSGRICKDHKFFRGIIGKFSKEGILLDIFSGLPDAEKAGFTRPSIAQCCKKKRRTHKGFMWRRFPLNYKFEMGKKYDLDSPIFNFETRKYNKKKKTSKQLELTF